AARPSRDAPPTPRSGPRDRDERSPLAQSVAPPPMPGQPPEHTTLTSASGVPTVPLLTSGPPPVAYELFSSIDMRVGVILSAARVPRWDKVLELSVDVGDEGGPRRVLSGLALSYAPEELVGQRVVVVCNLEPRDFGKGLISHGLILAAGPS